MVLVVIGHADLSKTFGPAYDGSGDPAIAHVLYDSRITNHGLQITNRCSLLTILQSLMLVFVYNYPMQDLPFFRTDHDPPLHG